MKKYVKYDNINYFMPFLFCNDLYIPILKELLKDEINPVKYVYGSINCAWAGGRISQVKIKNLLHVENYLQRLKKYNLIPTFTFNRIKDIEKLLNDEFSNNLLDIAYKNNSHFIVATDALYNHIKARYPNAKIHCSVIAAINNFINDKNFDETKFYNDMLEKYDIVVVRPEYTLENLEKLDKIITDIKRIEVLINQFCQYNCPLHIKHYNSIEKINDAFLHDIKMNVEDYTECNCPYKKPGQNYDTPLVFNQEQIESLINIGVRNFKIQGREASFDLVFDYLYTFLFNNEFPKEEIKKKIDSICLNMLINNKKTYMIYI